MTLLGLTISMVWSTSAMAVALNIVIEGTVTSTGSVPVPAKQVAISCDNRLSSRFLGFVTTDSRGHYRLATTSDVCPLGSSVTVRGDEDGNGVYESANIGTVHEHTIVDLYLGRNLVVPEFGMVGAGISLIAGLYALIAVRRKTA